MSVSEIADRDVTAEPEQSEVTAEDHHEARVLELSLALGKVCVKLGKIEAVRKALKDDYKNVLQQLDALVENGPEELPLFDGPTATVSGGGDAWRDLPVDALDIPAGTQHKLEEAGLVSLGFLADAMNGERWQDKVDGVGEKAAEKIAEAFVTFWSDHPEYVDADRNDDRQHGPAGAMRFIRMISAVVLSDSTGSMVQLKPGALLPVIAENDGELVVYAYVVGGATAQIPASASLCWEPAEPPWHVIVVEGQDGGPRAFEVLEVINLDRDEARVKYDAASGGEWLLGPKQWWPAAE